MRGLDSAKNLERSVRAIILAAKRSRMGLELDSRVICLLHEQVKGRQSPHEKKINKNK